MTTVNRILRAADPLDSDCGSIDTSFPLLKADSMHRCTLKVKGKEPSKKDAGKDVITVDCAINKDTTGTKNEPIRAGFPVKHYLTIDLRTPDATAETCKRIAEVVKATGRKLTPRQVIEGDGLPLDGAVVDAKMKIKPAKDGYPEGNAIGTFIPVS